MDKAYVALLDQALKHQRAKNPPLPATAISKYLSVFASRFVPPPTHAEMESYLSSQGLPIIDM
jgi:hypothetical protein